MSGEIEHDDRESTPLLERESELAAIGDSLARVRRGGSGGVLLIDGPAGIGKTSLLTALGRRAEVEDYRVLRAQGSELERNFGFGVARQLFGPLLRTLGADGRSRLFSGPAALAAAIFGLDGGGRIEVGAAEASLYGLFWMIAGLAEGGPLVLAVDDAHRCDSASLRFVQYLSRRLDGMPLLIVLAARPNEPGLQAEMLRGLSAGLDAATVSPPLLSEAGTAAIVRVRLGDDVAARVGSACHRTTGGNPFLIEELMTELETEAQSAAPISPEAVATIGAKRIGASVAGRALAIDPQAPEVVRAIAVLGGGADLRAVAGLAEIDLERAAAIVDGLAAAAILDQGPRHRFAHPLLSASVYEEIPAATRSVAHARAATLLAEQGAEPEETAAHLLLSEPGAMPGALEVLDLAATRAAERGAPDSATAYLRRALEEAVAGERRSELLHRLGRAGVALRDPASIGHLQEAVALTGEPERALEISLELIEVLSIAGLWEAAIATIDAAVDRFGRSELPGVLELEAFRAASRGYDPATAAEYEADLPRLLATVLGRHDEESAPLRWVLAGLGAIQDLPREEVLELIGPISQEWTQVRGGRENSLISNALLSLVFIDALDDGGRIAAALLEDGRRRGSLMGMIVGTCFAASMDARAGRLGPSEASLGTAIELIQTNELSLMALTTALHFCLETIVERRQLEYVADLVEGLELPPPFGDTHSGGMAQEVRAAVRTMRGDRAGAIAALRAAEEIYRPLRVGPRFSSWRSRLALALPGESREEALALAAEELELARSLDSPRAVGVALRTLGVLDGEDAGIANLRESVRTLRDSPTSLELARSLAELGAALRRANQRNEARERLREAADLAQRCGAERLEDRVLEELRIAGAKPRRRAISGAGSLTPAELRVAVAAGGGATNREIAQTLFVSLRTVEMHLTNAYRKLGISSREELAATIGEAVA